MGVAGSGKTTIATALAERFGWSQAEADDFHSPANRAKMAAGTPLTDDDRWPWLESIRNWIDGEPGDLVLTCSALREVYRDVLRSAGTHRVRFLHLDGAAAVVRDRISARTGHYMPPSLLDSQFDTLEPLRADEDGVRIDVSGSVTEVLDAAMRALDLS